MNKTLRIFAKDVRHLWPEILVSLALAVGFAATDHLNWPQFRNAAFRESETLRTWMQILLPISWALLIARAVHDESLVGDRQFWITRPYGWPRILTAKLLFIAAFILTPYLLAQCFLLHQARLHPLAVLPGLAFTLVMVFGFYLLPLMALSAVTASITRIFIIIFVAALYAGLSTYIGSISGTPAGWVPGSQVPYLAAAFFTVPLITLVVVLLQYARRRTALSAALLLVLVAILTAGCLAEYYMPNRIGDYTVLAANETSPVKVALDPDSHLREELFDNPQEQAKRDLRNEREASVPLILSGIASGHAVDLDGHTVTISAPGMKSETIAWTGSGGSSFGRASPYVSDTGSWITLPAGLVREFAGKMVSIHVTYAVTELEAETPVEVPFNDAAMDIPENGHCIKVPDPGISCQYAMSGPSITHIIWKLQTSCGVSGSDAPQQDWVGTTEHSIRDFDISPLASFSTSINTRVETNHPKIVYVLCPGILLTFTKYHVGRRRLIDVTLPPLDPRVYVHVERQAVPNSANTDNDSE